MTRRHWTRQDEAILAQLYPDHSSAALAVFFGRTIGNIYQKAQGMGLHKSEAYLASPAACRLRRGNNVGAECRFPPGHVPANKGQRRPGWAPGRMAETQFKKGRPASEARNYVPIGSERVTYGVLQRKVTDDPSLYPARRWVPVHRLVWEAANGPVPEGHIVVFRAGLKTLDAALITLDRIELVSYAENMRRNSYHTRYPKEIGDVIRLRGQINRQINRRQREKQD